MQLLTMCFITAALIMSLMKAFAIPTENGKIYRFRDVNDVGGQVRRSFDGLLHRSKVLNMILENRP